MKAWGVSDKGCVRATNQDAFLVDVMALDNQEIALLIVCDGMGGAKAGHVASKYAVEGFAGEIRRSLRPDLTMKDWKQILFNAVKQANLSVFDLSRQQPEFAGMGTTLVAALILYGQALVVNIGDSRCYLMGESLEQVTTDHSFVEQLVREGQLSQQEARNHPKKNLITRAVGVEPEIEADLFSLRFEAGQRLLLCSDGLSNMLTDAQIEQVCQGEEDDQLATQQLVELAKQAGGTDNITVVLATQQC